MVTYIGNRCIMTPEGIWSSTKSYEALSLVSHQTTGDGYVSRRAVPTGIDISDDTYWVKMTDFNVQLAAAQAAAEEAEENAAAALAGVEGKVDATKIITSKEALLALLETGYIADATLVRQLYNELNGKRQWTEQGEYTGNSIPAVSDPSAVDVLYEISDGFSGYSLMFRRNTYYVIRGRAYGANNNTYIDYVYNIWASNPFSFTAAIKDGSDVLNSITTRVSYR